MSSIDVFSAQFDASKLMYDQTAEVPGAQVPVLRGSLDFGATAATHGGVAVESTQYDFEPKPGRTSMDVYANEVVSQLQATEDRIFNFVLIHPQRRQASADIWGAFKGLVNACKQ